MHCRGMPRALEPKLAREQPAIAALLDGQRAAAQVWALHAERSGQGNAEGLRRLLLAIVRDLRVVPILLARQLARHARRRQRCPSRRTPRAGATHPRHPCAAGQPARHLAAEMGAGRPRLPLSGARHLPPHRAPARRQARRPRALHRAGQRAPCARRWPTQGIAAEVAGRPKHIYSIWKKMQKKDVPIGELYDLRAVRVLVDDVAACYAALGMVHALWAPVPSEFDDYIARPKHNDYRSLHTAVIGPEGKTAGSADPHPRDACAGRTRRRRALALQGRRRQARSARRPAMPRSTARSRGCGSCWNARRRPARRTARRSALAGELDTELVEDRIYVLTPQGEVVDLPRGGTALDFAYHVHTDVGHRCRGAKVDGRIVPLDHQLRSGDRVEILTAQDRRAAPRLAAGGQRLPRQRALARQGARLVPQARSRAQPAGRPRAAGQGTQAARPAAGRPGAGAAEVQRRHASTTCTCWSRSATSARTRSGARCSNTSAASAKPRRPTASELAGARAAQAARRRRPRRSPWQGVGNLLVQVARCCQPVPGEAIAGYLTRGRGVSVHRSDCAAFLRLAAAQSAARAAGGVGRGRRRPRGRRADRRALDRKYLLKDLTNLIAQEDAHVLSIQQRQRARQRPGAAAVCSCGCRTSASCRDCSASSTRCRGCEDARRVRLIHGISMLRGDPRTRHARQRPVTCAWRSVEPVADWREPTLGWLVASTSARARRARVPTIAAMALGAGSRWCWRWCWSAFRAAAGRPAVAADRARRRLRDAGGTALQQGRLTAADGSGARELYEAALALDPGSRARRARAWCGSRVRRWRRRVRALDADRFADAHAALRLARELSVPRADADAVGRALRAARSRACRHRRVAGAGGCGARRPASSIGSDAAACRCTSASWPCSRTSRALEGREDALAELLQQARAQLRDGELAQATAAIAHGARLRSRPRRPARHRRRDSRGTRRRAPPRRRRPAQRPRWSARRPPIAGAGEARPAGRCDARASSAWPAPTRSARRRLAARFPISPRPRPRWTTPARWRPTLARAGAKPSAASPARSRRMRASAAACRRANARAGCAAPAGRSDRGRSARRLLDAAGRQRLRQAARGARARAGRSRGAARLGAPAAGGQCTVSSDGLRDNNLGRARACLDARVSAGDRRGAHSRRRGAASRSAGWRWATNGWCGRTASRATRGLGIGARAGRRATPGLAEFGAARARGARRRNADARLQRVARDEAPAAPSSRAASSEKCRATLSSPLRGESRPQRLVAYRRTTASAKACGIVGDQHVAAVAQVHAFDRARRRHHRLAVRHAQVDLALDAGAVAQRRDRDAAAVHVRRDVGHVAVDDDAVVRRPAPGSPSATSPPMQWKRTSGSRARTRGNTSRRRTSAPRRRSADGGSRRRTPGRVRCANGAPGPATWCRLDSTSTRAPGASRRQQLAFDAR